MWSDPWVVSDVSCENGGIWTEIGWKGCIDCTVGRMCVWSLNLWIMVIKKHIGDERWECDLWWKHDDIWEHDEICFIGLYQRLTVQQPTWQPLDDYNRSLQKFHSQIERHMVTIMLLIIDVCPGCQKHESYTAEIVGGVPLTFTLV